MARPVERLEQGMRIGRKGHFVGVCPCGFKTLPKTTPIAAIERIEMHVKEWA